MKILSVVKIKPLSNIKLSRLSMFVLAFISVFLASFCVGATARAASLDFYASSNSYRIGDIFSIRIGVSSADQAMNAVSGVVSFPSDKIEATSLSKSGSIISLWVQEPSFSNAAGTVNFEGIVLNPGFIGTGGRILIINFKAKSAGKANLSFFAGSVLANDGSGTNILQGLGSASLDIKDGASAKPSREEETIAPKSSKVPAAPEIFSPTHPKQEQWYSNSNPEFNWNNSGDIIGVSFVLDDNFSGIPGSISDGLVAAKNYENLADGVWYFHLKLKNSFGWGAISNYKVQIDTVPPKQFAISFVDGKETENPCSGIIFSTEDQRSGMAYYKIKVGEGDYNTVVPDVVKNNNPYILPCQDSGKKIIIVEAYDNAGNYTVATGELSIKTIAPPIFTDYPKQIQTDDILIGAGKAAPNAKITIWLQREKDEAKSIAVKSDEKGDFSFIFGEKLKEGVYKMWAETVDSKGAKSGPSEKITVEAIGPYFLKIGRLVIDYFTTIITLIVLLVGLLTIIIYLYYKIRRWKNMVRKETEDTKNITAKAFKALVEEVEEQVANIDGNPRLNEREKKVSESLKKSLKIAEGFIEKEIKDIEDEVE